MALPLPYRARAGWSGPLALACLALGAAQGCTIEFVARDQGDASADASGDAADAGLADAAVDAGLADAGNADSGAPDAAAVDAGVADTGTSDAGPVVPPTISYPSDDVYAVLGRPALPFAPALGGTAPTVSIAPGLPAGLSIDSSTGVIAGTPSAVADGVAFTVTASNSAGAATAAFTLTVLPGQVVDSTLDAPDTDAGADGICLSTAGGCTLRAAIQTCNSQTSKQLILLGAADYPLDSALDPITNDTLIVGQGVGKTVVRAASPHPGYGMLSLASAHTLSLRHASFADFGPADGAVANVTAGALEASDCAFTGNLSNCSGGVFIVTTGASVTAVDSTFTGNTATSVNTGCNGWGGVIDAEGTGTTAVFKRCTATGNTADFGSFSHITSGSTLWLENSTLYGNVTNVAGTLASPGGVYTLVNDTIVNNTNTNIDSAGIYLYSTPAAYTVANCIVAFNTDASGAQNNCNKRRTATVVTSQGGNIISDGAGNCGNSFNQPGDLLSTDPGLVSGPPSPDNGGRTATILLSTSSVAVDAAVNSVCPAEDQRRLPRPVAKKGSAICDVGAVEMQ